MRLGGRAKLLLLASLFALPIVASLLAYRYTPPAPTANFGELLLPPAHVTSQPLERPDGSRFAFADLEGRWALVASDSGECAAACREKLTTLRQVRIALGRNAGRVERVLVIDDAKALAQDAWSAFDGMIVATTPRGVMLPPGAGNDRAHVYLVDPHGNVMMRWPAQSEPRRLFKDLERLLKASQIG